MTYQEIKDRLSKCELTLEKFKNGSHKNIDSVNVKETAQKLEVLRESLLKQLKEAQEKTYLVTPKSGKTAALSLGDDEVDALKDADDIDKIKSSDGQEIKEMKPGDPEDLKRKRMERLTPKDQETIAKIYALMQNANDIEENEAHDEGGDLDIGHQDDEPNMLMKDIYDIATYAAKLHKMLQKYDQFDGEVDFPHWWQSKIVKAREYISAAQHYLEAEEKQPALDALALEGKDMGVSKDKETKFHKNLDTLVHKTFGKRKEELEEASYNKLKKEYDALVGKMKQLAQHYKTAEGEAKAKIVAALKQHTGRKKELEAQLDQSVGGMGAGQELDPNVNERAKRAENVNEASAEDLELKAMGKQAFLAIKKQGLRPQYVTDDSYKWSYDGNVKNNMTAGILVKDGILTITIPKPQNAKSAQETGNKAKAIANELTPQSKERGLEHQTSIGKDDKGAEYYMIRFRKQEIKTGSAAPEMEKLNEYRGVEDDIRAIIRDKAADSGFDEQEEAMEVMEFIGQEYDIDFEFGAGPSRQMQEAKGGKYVVRPCSAKNTPWAVWKTSADGENDKRIKGFKTKPEAKKFADEKNGTK